MPNTYGNVPAHRNARERDPQVGQPGTVLLPPAWLTDDEAREVFAMGARDLDRLGCVAQPSDALALALWAGAVVVAQRNLATLLQGGDAKTLEHKRASVATWASIDRAAKLAASLGLTPADRQRLGIQRLETTSLLRALGVNMDEDGAA